MVSDQSLAEKDSVLFKISTADFVFSLLMLRRNVIAMILARRGWGQGKVG